MSTEFHPRLKAVIFDLDGTLLDTAPEFVEVVHQLRDEHGLDRLENTLIRSQVSNGARALVTLALGLAEEAPQFESKRLRLLEIYQGLLGSAASLFPGLQDLLEELEGAGIHWGISTNKPSYLTEILLERLQLDPAPGSVVCADQVSHPKPHPEPLYLNCRQLDCQPHEVIYVGDHLRDIQAGRNAGMYTIAAGYGYIEDGDEPGGWGADATVAHSAELRAELARAWNQSPAHTHHRRVT